MLGGSFNKMTKDGPRVSKIDFKEDLHREIKYPVVTGTLYFTEQKTPYLITAAHCVSWWYPKGRGR